MNGPTTAGHPKGSTKGSEASPSFAHTLEGAPQKLIKITKDETVENEPTCYRLRFSARDYAADLPNSLRTAAAALPTLSTARCSSSRDTSRCFVQYFTSWSSFILIRL